MSLVIGVEGGGSHMYVLGLDTALKIMHEGIMETLKKSNLDLSNISHVGITASGFNTQDPEIFKFFEEQKYPKISICQDTDGPAISYLKQNKKPCAVVISGTGQASKVFIDEKANLLLEGFGHALNECGCAYTNSRLFVNTVIRQFDMGDETNKPAYELFAKEMNISTDYRSDDLLTLFYGQNKQKIASFTKFMVENVNKYPIFMKILEQTLDELAEVICITHGAFKRLANKNNIEHIPEKVPMLKVGGFWNFAKNQMLLDKLYTSLKKHGLNPEKDLQLLDCPDVAPAVGAALLGIGGDFSGLNVF